MFKAVLDLIKETFTAWGEHQASRLAAALAYYTVFSLPSLLFIVIGVVGLVLGRSETQSALIARIQSLLGPAAADAVKTLIGGATTGHTGTISTIIGAVTLALGATGIFTQLKAALNTVWEVVPQQKAGPLQIVLTQVLSFAMVVGVALLLLASLLISAGISAVAAYLTGLVPGAQYFAQALNFVVVVAVLTLAFALVYKFLPDGEVAWRDVWVGAAATAALFTIGELAIGIVLGLSRYTSAFGALGALMLILVWIYYSAQIMLLGAQVTEVYARRYGSRIVPDEVVVGQEADEGDEAKEDMAAQATTEEGGKAHANEEGDLPNADGGNGGDPPRT